ncbi:hypothetical protein [Natrinema halophilum]|uniref:PH domain-containing protein n=1 Tax=Natrinema halophilum TaxID=1699371 RepID=A0A7D5K851_9EURY|nr:hypothetical protein [Natrinema halophilum]QLG50503.1 hypothetical protein HYG82_17435 [Natrinema halophilum]
MGSLRTRLALGFGVWVTSTFTPLVSFAGSGAFDASVRAGTIAIAGGLFILGTIIARLGLRTVADPASRFRDGLEMAGLIAIAGIELTAAVPAAFAVGVIAALPFGVGGALGVLSAFLVGYVADRAVVARIRSETERRTRWSAKKRPAPRWRRVGSAVAVVGTVVWAFIAVTAGEVLFATIPAILGTVQLGTLLQGVRRRRYVITDSGLITAVGLIMWKNFDSYSVTDDALILHGNVWLFGTIAYDRESVDDLETVIDSLDHYLARQDGTHSDPSILDTFRQMLRPS